MTYRFYTANYRVDTLTYKLTDGLTLIMENFHFNFYAKLNFFSFDKTPHKIQTSQIQWELINDHYGVIKGYSLKTDY